MTETHFKPSSVPHLPALNVSTCADLKCTNRFDALRTRFYTLDTHSLPNTFSTRCLTGKDADSCTFTLNLLTGWCIAWMPAWIMFDLLRLVWGCFCPTPNCLVLPFGVKGHLLRWRHGNGGERVLMQHALKMCFISNAALGAELTDFCWLMLSFCRQHAHICPQKWVSPHPPSKSMDTSACSVWNPALTHCLVKPFLSLGKAGMQQSERQHGRGEEKKGGRRRANRWNEGQTETERRTSRQAQRVAQLWSECGQ